MTTVGERGTGLIGTLAGVTVFLSLMTVAVQVLVDLHQTSVVTSAGLDAARWVANGADQELASAHARHLLGGVGDEAVLSWEVSDDVVRLRLVVPTRRFLLPAVSGVLGLDEVDRTVTVRTEQARP